MSDLLPIRRYAAKKTAPWEETVRQFFLDYIGEGNPGFGMQRVLLKSLAFDIDAERRQAYKRGWRIRDINKSLNETMQ